jgi:hypothetical protein
MATPKDEFDPPKVVLNAVIGTVLNPQLAKLEREIEIPCKAQISVLVREDEIHKYTLVDGLLHPWIDAEPNTFVRIRFRRTIKEERVLFSIETQHSEQWRKHGFSGVRMHGDVNTKTLDCQRRAKSICYNGGWMGW